jgi:hypothetical protein
LREKAALEIKPKSIRFRPYPSSPPPRSIEDKKMVTLLSISARWKIRAPYRGSGINNNTASACLWVEGIPARDITGSDCKIRGSRRRCHRECDVDETAWMVSRLSDAYRLAPASSNIASNYAHRLSRDRAPEPGRTR